MLQIGIAVIAGLAAAVGDGVLAPPVRLAAGETWIDTGEEIAHAGPSFHDLDGDGRRDLLVGNFAGTLAHYRNVGTAAAPKFEAKGFLAAEGAPIKIKNW
ncbi:MAG: hypothetical protein FJ293_14815 [Planctomycetes bacterium]|nr:hypothetical protein [Planctomycetota bacterium]